MEIIAPKAHVDAGFFLNTQFNYLNNFAANPKTQIQLPLHRPEYKPPLKTVRLKPTIKKPKPKPKPVATTSDILRLMDGLKLTIPIDMYTSLIKECTEMGDPLKAIDLHEHIKRSGIRLSLPLVNWVMLMFVSCGCFGHARHMFDEMSIKDFYSWAILIAGCEGDGEHGEVIKLFIRMLRDIELENASPGQMGLPLQGILMSVFRACEWTVDFELGRQVHGWLWKMGFARSAALSSFLISFYGKLKHYEDAQRVFEQVYRPDTAIWTSRIVNCCSDDNFEGLFNILKEMGLEGVRKNEYTFSTLLKACRRMGAIGYGRQVHANAMKLGLESDGFVQCALVDLYGKCGFLRDATRVFETSRNTRNKACYNAMLTNYMQHGLFVEAMTTLYEMKIVGFQPRKSMFDEVRLACGSKEIVDKNEFM